METRLCFKLRTYSVGCFDRAYSARCGFLYDLRKDVNIFIIEGDLILTDVKLRGVGGCACIYFF